MVGGGIESDLKRHGRGHTFLSRGRDTASHIRGRNPVAAPAALLHPQSRGRAPVFGEKGGGARSEIKK